MKTKTISKDEVIYQIEDNFEGISPTVVIDIVYSGNEDEDGNEILEFECAVAESENNPELTKEQLQEVNKILECGQEEKYVRGLTAYYLQTDINFDPNEYRDILGLPLKR